jgi:hypothetical protein
LHLVDGLSERILDGDCVGGEKKSGGPAEPEASATAWSEAVANASGSKIKPTAWSEAVANASGSKNQTDGLE